MNDRGSKDSCRECKYFVSKEGSNGECHCHSPQVVVMQTTGGGNNTFTRWPEVEASQFCGDFEYGTQ